MYRFYLNIEKKTTSLRFDVVYLDLISSQFDIISRNA